MEYKKNEDNEYEYKHAKPEHSAQPDAEKYTEAMDVQVQESDTGIVAEELTQMQEISGAAPDAVGNMHIPEDYKRIDIRI